MKRFHVDKVDKAAWLFTHTLNKTSYRIGFSLKSMAWPLAHTYFRQRSGPSLSIKILFVDINIFWRTKMPGADIRGRG